MCTHHQKKQFVIVGTTPYSVEVYSFISAEGNAEILAFSSHRDFMRENMLCGLPIIPLEDLGNRFDMTKVEVLNTIGYTHMNSIRQRVNDDIEARQYKIGSYISSNSLIYSKINGGG